MDAVTSVKSKLECAIGENVSKNIIKGRVDDCAEVVKAYSFRQCVADTPGGEAHAGVGGPRGPGVHKPGIPRYEVFPATHHNFLLQLHRLLIRLCHAE